MYALKQEAMAQGVYPQAASQLPVLAREFFRGVEKTAATAKGRLMVKFFLKTNPFGMLKNTHAGVPALAHRPALAARRRRMKRPGDIATLLRAAKQPEGGR